MELLLMSWRSISTAAVLSTELPSCVTGSRAIQRGRFSLCMWIYSIWCHLNLQYDYNYADISSLNCLFLAPFRSFAYIEFSDRDSVTSAIGLHETLFRGRVLKVRSIKTMWWCWWKTQTSHSNCQSHRLRTHWVLHSILYKMYCLYLQKVCGNIELI